MPLYLFPLLRRAPQCLHSDLALLHFLCTHLYHPAIALRLAHHPTREQCCLNGQPAACKALDIQELHVLNRL